MNSYKRIVSYIYYYSNGEKKNNVGYVRMERKDGICKVTMHMRSINSNDKKLGVYFFYREKEQLVGISLGNMIIKNGIGEFRKVIEEEVTKGLQVTLEEMGGIIIYENNEHFFATQWDDEFINIMKFYIEDSDEKGWKQEQLEKKEEDKVKAADCSAIKAQEMENGRQEGELEIDKLIEEELVDKELESQEIEHKEINVEKEKNEGIENKNLKYEEFQSKESEKEELKREKLEDDKTKKEEFVKEEIEHVESVMCESENDELKCKISDQEKKVSNVISIETKEMEHNPQMRNQKNMNHSSLNLFRINQAINRFSARTQKIMQDEKQQISNHHLCQNNMQERQEKTEDTYSDKQLTNKWRQQVREQQKQLESQVEYAEKIFMKFPPIDLCNKEVFKKCVKIEPQDIGSFPMETWVLANNSFLLHGYYNYRYLIFAQHFHEGQWEYVIGVPGIYEPKEHFMAKMFGFQNFCPTNQKEQKTGAFGYWYQVIHL